MLSSETVRAAIDKAEEDFETCWKTLALMKHGPIPPDFGEHFLAFQPTLATALFKLDDVYRRLRKEEKTTIASDQTGILYQSDREYTTRLSGDGGLGQGGRRLSPLAPVSTAEAHGVVPRSRTHAAALQVTGAGGRYPSELCGRTVL